ncbi:MAG: P-type conjugative transfer ATPase TrbB [Candidatus Omnitrophica bacterium]|nr:P-type conjugative transfer ATPase TrbB [Candidatus Omnitrophota bacterium]
MLHSHSKIQEKLRFALGEDIYSALSDPNVIEVMLNGDGKVWLDTFSGMNYFCDLDSGRAKNLINTVASVSEVVVNRDSPSIEGEIRVLIEDDLKLFRFQGLIPPISSYPIFNIRKPSSRVIPLDDYLKDKVINQGAFQYLRNAVSHYLSILIVGGTGSGKTTLANALLNEIAIQTPKDRVAIIEDTVELQCNVENKIQLRTSDNRSMNDLLRYCMRLRPDRIIVGEVRGKEALSLIKAWNTGHRGGVSTVHANSAYSGLLRLEQLVQEANVNVVPESVAEAINIIVYITRSSGNVSGWLVESVLRVKGYNKNNNEYILQEVTNEKEYL